MQVIIKVRLPRSGYYVLSLFSEIGDGTLSSPKKNSLVYSYLLEVPYNAVNVPDVDCF